MSLHAALVNLFGAEPEDIRITSLDHLATTLSADKVRALLLAVGGRWTDVVRDADAHVADRKTRLDGAGVGLELAKETP
jgi:hypothetical protein